MQRMRSDWRVVSVPPEAPVRAAMQAVDRGRLGMALVVDPETRLRGTVTDGDLRRAILAGVGLDATVERIMNRKFTAVPAETSVAHVLQLMHDRSIKQVPVVDSESRVVGLYFLPDLVEPVVRPNWAVVMAGGQGQRMRPLTSEIPKPMLPVGNRPLLESTISLLVQHGFRRVFVAINYRGEQIQTHFGAGDRFGCEIVYLEEAEPLGTAGALSLLPERPADALLVVNGDLLTDVDLSALIDYHAETGCAATQCVREHAFHIPFGIVECVDGEVCRIDEKPVHRYLINAGIYVLSPLLVGSVPPSEQCSMIELLERARRQGYRVAAFPIRERWADIGAPEDYLWAQGHWTADGGVTE